MKANLANFLYKLKIAVAFDEIHVYQVKAQTDPTTGQTSYVVIDKNNEGKPRKGFTSVSSVQSTTDVYGEIVSIGDNVFIDSELSDSAEKKLSFIPAQIIAFVEGPDPEFADAGIYNMMIDPARIKQLKAEAAALVEQKFEGIDFSTLNPQEQEQAKADKKKQIDDTFYYLISKESGNPSDSIRVPWAVVSYKNQLKAVVHYNLIKADNKKEEIVWKDDEESAAYSCEQFSENFGLKLAQVYLSRLEKREAAAVTVYTKLAKYTKIVESIKEGSMDDVDYGLDNFDEGLDQENYVEDEELEKIRSIYRDAEELLNMHSEELATYDEEEELEKVKEIFEKSKNILELHGSRIASFRNSEKSDIIDITKAKTLDEFLKLASPILEGKSTEIFQNQENQNEADLSDTSSIESDRIS